MGIEPEQLEAIFDPFFKADPARPSDGSGAGIGLAIVKKIIDLHNGKITVTSNPSQGSTFCLMLPLNGNPTSTEPRESFA
jgi:signal transduction histidine kinase